MTQFTIAAAELRRIALAVEKSAAKDDSRPVLAGIHARIEGDRLTLTAADGFRLSSSSATLDTPAETDATAILARADVLAFAKSLKPKLHPHATIDVAGDAWTFSANGTRATVRLIDGTYPDFQSIVGSGDEPVLFTVDPRFLRDLPITETVTVSRATDDPHAPLFLTDDAGGRHVLMPMVKPASAEWKRREDAAPAATIADEQTKCPRCDFSRDLAAGGFCHQCTAELAHVTEPEPAPVMPEESAFRTQREANARRTVKRAQRRAAADAGTTSHDAPICATCDTHATPADNFCAECGSAFGEPAPVSITRPVSTPYALAAYSEKNQQRILEQCPDASDVRGFHAWLKVGRVVRKGQKGIKIVAPVMGGDDGGKVVNIKPAHVFDVSQTDERTARAAA